MNKRIVVPVSCANSFASGVPEHFTTTIDTALRERIQTLASAVHELDVRSVDEWLKTGTWSIADVAELEESKADFDAMVTAMEAEAGSVELRALHVSANSFWFSAMVPGGDGDIALWTQRIPLSALVDEIPLAHFDPSVDVPEDGDYRLCVINA